ncbi:MAG: cytochrome b/b6 domain-containing protein [Bacteroidota bacterium]|nr:cytochrome b/b6 domain-containing protein [Bacteroidota bacterium]
MKKVYIYQAFERFWHWAQTVLIFSLTITGFEIHSSYELLGYDVAVQWHNYGAWAFIVLIVFAIFWHVTTDAWKNYIPTMKNFKAQLDFYLFGIFRDAPHPTHKKLLSKLNPLQRVIYLGLKVLVIPVMVGSGLFYYYFNYPETIMEVSSLQPIAIIHTFGAYILIAFVVVHLYLITTGHTIFSNLNAMVTGWEEMDDDEVKEIVEEAIEEAGQKIISTRKSRKTDTKDVKDIVADAMHETEKKVRDNELDSQKKLKDIKK